MTTLYHERDLRQEVSLLATAQAMQELVIPGKTPNGKLAFWNACLSTRNPLDRNCRQALVMRGYVNRPLPVNHDDLRGQLGAILTRTLESLYEIEKLWNAGIIHFNTGSTFDEQSRWRDSMVAAIPGMGMKTVSFALHIYSPETCLLLTIDCWHLKRLGASKQAIRRNDYLYYEQALRDDCVELAQEEGTGYPAIVYAACLWERTRKYFGASQCEEGYQSHAGLSCYV